MTRIFDTHAHYYCRQFNKDLPETINAIKATVSGCINIGTDGFRNKMVLTQSQSFTDKDFHMFAAVGFFPTDVYKMTQSEFKKLGRLLQHENVIALGEIGLDLYHAGPEDIPLQKEGLLKQLALAKKYNKPVILHEREAFPEMIETLSEFGGPIKGVIHSFSHGIKEAEKYLELGLHFGFGGMCTYPNNSQILDWAAICPEDKILLETDSPYLSPQEVRRQRNDSSNIIYVAEVIGKRRALTAEEVIQLANKNAEKLFNIKLS